MAFRLDAAAVAVLIYWQPVPGSVMTRARLAARTLLFCLVGIMGVSGRDTEKRNQGLLEVFPQMLDLGNVPQGKWAQAKFVLRNPHSEPIVITHVETSCPCLDIRLPAEAVPPEGEMKGEVFLDMSREPHFSGRMDLQARAKAKDSEIIAFVIFAKVTVKAIDGL